MPLTDSKIRSIKASDRLQRHVDGHGLYLEITPGGKRSWKYRYEFNGKETRITIGPYPQIGLADARKERERIRALVVLGLNPAQEKKTDKIKRRIESDNTFRSIACEWLMKQESHWTPYYFKQASNCLEQNAFPSIGDLPIRMVTPAHILDILRRMEDRGAHTYAIMLRQWISSVFRHAVVTLRAEIDPAAPLKGAIRRPPVEHSRALTREEIAEFKSKVDAYGGNRTTVIALEMILLTFVRTVELRMAEWSEFDLEKKLWTIPAARMKKRKIHLVPMSDSVVSLITELSTITGANRYLFPNMRDPKKCMSGTTINRAIEYMGYESGFFTGHDFRATASTWLNEMGFRADVIERQLAHVEKNQVRKAYNHAQYLPERQDMMQKWADWLEGC